MRLSEAIRLGAMLKPQAYGHYRHDGGTCAIEAAREAAGDDDEAIGLLVYQVNQLPCPVSGCGHNHLRYSTIPHLNDGHRWTREQIADWVATVEMQMQQPEPFSRFLPATVTA